MHTSISAVWVVGRTKPSHTLSYLWSFSFTMSSWNEFIWARKTHDIMWCLNLINALVVSKYSIILNVQLLEGEVACGNALYIRLVRVRWNVKEQSINKKIIMKRTVFHMYKNPIESVHVMHCARWKPHFEEKHWRWSQQIWLQSIILIT